MSPLGEVDLLEESYDYNPLDADMLRLDVPDLREQEGFTFPAILLSRVLFQDCLKVLQSCKRSSYREMDVWVELPAELGFNKIGSIQVDSDVLLLLRHLGIQATMYYAEDQMEVLNLDDPEVLERFV